MQYGTKYELSFTIAIQLLLTFWHIPKHITTKSIKSKIDLNNTKIDQICHFKDSWKIFIKLFAEAVVPLEYKF